MGIYLFNRQTLLDALEKTNYRDFGKEVFPASIRTKHVQLHLFDGYFEDIGTIKAFYEANLQLAGPTRPSTWACPNRPSTAGRGSCPPHASIMPRSAIASWPTAAGSRKGR